MKIEKLSKHVVFVVIFLISIVGLRADDITMRNGEKLIGVSISSVEPDGITIAKKDGVVKIPFTNLLPEICNKYSYDPQKAAAYKEAWDNAREAAVKRAALQELIKKFSESGFDAEVEIIQVLDNGILVNAKCRDDNGLLRSGWAFIRLQDTNGMVDDQRYRTKLYYVGTYRYESTSGAVKTVRKYATSPEDAAVISLSNE